jgi:hypothetical protein
MDYDAYLAGWHPGSILWKTWPSRMGTNTHVESSEWHPSPAHFVTFPLDSEGDVCKMRGERVRNEQDARGKLAQKFAQPGAFTYAT